MRFADKSYTCAIGEEESLAIDDAPKPEAPNDDRRPARRRRRDARHQGDTPRGGESPNGEWTAAIEGRRIVFKAKSGDESHTVEVDGPAESFIEQGLAWSPDGRFAVALRTTPGEDHKVHVVESSPRDQLQPKLHTWDYLKPGDRIPQTFPVLVDLREWREIPVDSRDFANPWSIDDIRWSEDSSRFVFAYNERGHQVLRVISVDAATGTPTVIVNETSPTFLDYAHKRYLWWSRDGGELLWMSERDGWNHVYRVDGRTGAVLNPVTRGEWVVRAVERVDPRRRRLWVRVGGVRPGEDPYHVHLATVEFDGSGFTLLTEGDGTHECELSPDGTVFVDTWSRVDQPPVAELRDALSGRRIATLETADWSPLLETGWKPPQRFTAKGRDGKTDIYGVVYRPSNFSGTASIRSWSKSMRGRTGRSFPNASRIIIRRKHSPSWVSSWFRSTAWGPATAPRRFTTWPPETSATRASPTASHGSKRWPRPNRRSTSPPVSGFTADRREDKVRCGRSWRTATSTRPPWPTAVATTTAWTRSGGTNCGWVIPLDRITPSSRMSPRPTV